MVGQDPTKSTYFRVAPCFGGPSYAAEYMSKEFKEAKLLAISEGLHLAAEWVHFPVVLESDCLTVIQQILSKDRERSRWPFLLQQIKASMASLQDIVLAHCNRDCNRIARELAQLAKRTVHCAVWWNNAPDGILQALKHDCIPISKN
uniref:RNase H type-1 domain-containing protein n=1 Tax=Leersia perrieri TaxID=77586 RepID=A0A0D9VG97_9ORYZ